MQRPSTIPTLQIHRKIVVTAKFAHIITNNISTAPYQQPQKQFLRPLSRKQVVSLTQFTQFLLRRFRKWNSPICSNQRHVFFLQDWRGIICTTAITARRSGCGHRCRCAGTVSHEIYGIITYALAFLNRLIWVRLSNQSYEGVHILLDHGNKVLCLV